MQDLVVTLKNKVGYTSGSRQHRSWHAAAPKVNVLFPENREFFLSVSHSESDSANPLLLPSEWSSRQEQTYECRNAKIYEYDTKLLEWLPPPFNSSSPASTLSLLRPSNPLTHFAHLHVPRVSDCQAIVVVTHRKWTVLGMRGDWNSTSDFTWTWSIKEFGEDLRKIDALSWINFNAIHVLLNRRQWGLF